MKRSLVMLAMALGLALAAGSGAVAGSLVTSAKIKDNTIRSADVRNGTLRLPDLSAPARRGLRGPRGPEGPQGEPGPSHTMTFTDYGGVSTKPWSHTVTDLPGGWHFEVKCAAAPDQPDQLFVGKENADYPPTVISTST